MVHVISVVVFRAFAGCPGKLIAQLIISFAKEKDVIGKHATSLQDIMRYRITEQELLKVI